MCFALEYCNAPVSHNLETHNLPPRIPTVTNQEKQQQQHTLQPIQPLIPQPILRQHPPHRPLQHLPTPPFPYHTLHTQTLHHARSRGPFIVHLLLLLFARHEHIVAVRGHDVVAAVGGGIPDRFVFSHEEDGDAGCEAAEGWGGGGGEGDVVPYSAVC